MWGDERHAATDVLSEEALALLCLALREDTTRCGELARSTLELREFQDVQSCGDREEVVDFEDQRRIRLSHPDGHDLGGELHFVTKVIRVIGGL